jgi:hypothetical protein
MPASLKVVTKHSLSSFISVEPANKQCVYGWGRAVHGLIDRKSVIRRKRELWAQNCTISKNTKERLGRLVAVLLERAIRLRSMLINPCLT